MASIVKRPNGMWRARYRDETGKEHARHFDRKSDGQQWLDQVTASVVRGDYVDPKAGKVTLETYARQWESIQVASESTKRIIDNALRLHIIPDMGAYPLATIRPSRIQAFVKRLESKGLAAGTIRGIFHVLTQVCAAAVDDRVISQTPCRKVTLPRSDESEVIPPTIEQVQAFTEAIGERWAAAVVTLAGSGLRIGELLGLEVTDVDFLRRTIRVERQRNQQGLIRLVKTKTSKRTVPVGQVVVDTLAAHLAAYPSESALFVDEVGEPLLYRRWRSLSEAAARRAEIDLSAHSLRHFYASALIAGGASVKQVQVRLGHASPVITLETYSHLWPGEDDVTRNVIDGILAPLADSVRTGVASNS